MMPISNTINFINNPSALLRTTGTLILSIRRKDYIQKKGFKSFIVQVKLKNATVFDISKNI